MTLEKADPTSLALQREITGAVAQKVADQATYSIRFKGRAEVTAISAKGAEELYAQCVTRDLCPEIQLVVCADKVVEGQWICDGIWRATWIRTGETYTIDARGSEPYPGGASNDPMSVVNRKAMGKALRNAHLKIVPSVIREAYLSHLRETTGRDVVHSEEYTQTPPSPKQTATAGKQPATAGKKAPHQVVYEHAKSLGLNPVDDAEILFTALGGQTVPQFLASKTPDEACALISDWTSTTPVNTDSGESEANDNLA
jgi:hypothetical protein